jgi:hypothetical protein
VRNVCDVQHPVTVLYSVSVTAMRSMRSMRWGSVPRTQPSRAAYGAVVPHCQAVTCQPSDRVTRPGGLTWLICFLLPSGSRLAAGLELVVHIPSLAGCVAKINTIVYRDRHGVTVTVAAHDFKIKPPDRLGLSDSGICRFCEPITAPRVRNSETQAFSDSENWPLAAGKAHGPGHGHGVFILPTHSKGK